MLLSHHISTAVLIGADAVCTNTGKTRLVGITLRPRGLLLQDAENGQWILYPVNVSNESADANMGLFPFEFLISKAVGFLSYCTS